MQGLFDLELAKKREAARCLAMLGDYAHQELDQQQLLHFAQARFVPVRVLTAWKHAYQQAGEEGLIPNEWQPLKAKSQQIAAERYARLGKLVDACVITPDDICTLANNQPELQRKAERLIRRYQVNGVWGLAPEHDPEKASQKQKGKRPAPPDIAAVDDALVKEAERKRDLIAPFLHKKHITYKELEAHAKKHNDNLEEYAKNHDIELEEAKRKYTTSVRSLRDYLHRYRRFGLRGLLPRERSDKGHRHGISERMEDLIEAIRLSKRDIPLHLVHTLALQKALLLGEAPPSLWQVRRVCEALGDETTMIADGRYNEFRSKRRTTYRINFDGSVIILQIDYTPIDVLMRDQRRRGYRTKSEEKRPYLTLCMEASSRIVMSYAFTYDEPNSSTIASVIRDALTISPAKPYGGVPDAIWVDKGSQMVSNHVYQIARDLHIDLHVCEPNHEEDRGNPQEKGIVERFFRTLNTRLWSTLPGYTNSNTKDRHPDVKAELTLAEIVAHFKKHIDTYHHKTHSETQETPLQFWVEHCCALPPPNPRELDHLILTRHERVHIKEGIQYAGRFYWHKDLAGEVPVNATVVIRAQADYMKPDTIEVYYDQRWICTANAMDSVAGRQVTGKDVVTAQRKQKKRIKNKIAEKKAVLKQADQEIAGQQRHSSLSQEGTPAAPPTKPAKKRDSSVHSHSSPSIPKQQEQDIWGKLLAAKKQAQEKRVS